MLLNKVLVTGRLVRDPEERDVGSTKICSFSIAVNNSKKNQQTGEWEDDPAFIDCKCWLKDGRFPGNINQQTKGALVFVEGRIKMEKWVAQDGSNRSKLLIDAFTVQLVTPPAKKADQQVDDYQPPRPSKKQAAAVSEEDIPF